MAWRKASGYGGRWQSEARHCTPYLFRLRLGTVLLAFLDHLVLRLARHFLVMAEILDVDAAAAGERTQGARIAVEFLRRHVRFDELKRAVGVYALNLPAPAREVTHDLAHAILGNPDLHGMDRFKQAWARGGEGFLERKVAGDLERDVLRIDGVHFAVVEINLHVDDPITRDDPLLARLVHAFFHGRHESAVDVLAHERLLELQAGVARLRLDAHPDLGELARAAGLLFVAILGLAFRLDRFAIPHARLREFDVHAVAAAQALG